MKKALVIFTLLLVLVSVLSVNALVTKRISWGLDRITGNAVGPGPITIQPINASAPCPTKLKFTNGEGLNFDLNINVLADRVNVVSLGANKLHFYESNSRENKTIGLNEYFVLTEKSARVPFTHILQYTGHNPSSRTLSFNDIGRGSRQAVYDSASNSAILVIAGIAYRIYADPLTGRIAVDQNGDSSFDGSQAMIVDSNARAYPQENFINHPKCGFVATCADSDNGKNYSVFGNISGTFGGNNLTWNDYCANSTTLYEMYCENASIPSFNIHDCPYGCMNGVCVEAPTASLCTDSDGGLNITTFGWTDFKAGSFELRHSDACALVSSYDSNGVPQAWQGPDHGQEQNWSCSGADCYIQEAFCRIDEKGNFIDADADQLIKCPNGCQNGACLAAPTTVTSCNDSDNSPDYSQNLQVTEVTFEKAPDLFAKGIGTGQYGNGTPAIYGAGTNPNVAQPTTDPFSTYNDYCFNSQQLNEAYCNSEGKLSSHSINCPFGCRDGACLPRHIQSNCFDSDNSPNYGLTGLPQTHMDQKKNPDLYVRGYAIVRAHMPQSAPQIKGEDPNKCSIRFLGDQSDYAIFYDCCNDPYVLQESFCGGNHELLSVPITCAYSCKQGMCDPGPATFVCSDSDSDTVNSPNLNLKGVIKFPEGEYTDSCVNSVSPKTPCGPGITCDSVSEVDCDPNSPSGVSERVLPCQYGCSMGACLPPPQPTINCADVVYVAQGNTQQLTKESRIQYCLSSGLPWGGVILQAGTYNWYGNCRANSADGGGVWDISPNAQFNISTCQLTTQTSAAAQPSAAQATTTAAQAQATAPSPAPSAAQQPTAPAPTVKEVVGCLFTGSKNVNMCYSAKGDTCRGGSRCFVRTMEGVQGEKIVWRSTCKGVEVTTTDGINEWVQFTCGNAASVPLTALMNATIQQYK
jgi:hypothetical protein